MEKNLLHKLFVQREDYYFAAQKNESIYSYLDHHPKS